MRIEVLEEFEAYCNKMEHNGFKVLKTLKNLKTFEVETYKLIQLQKSLKK